MVNENFKNYIEDEVGELFNKIKPKFKEIAVIQTTISGDEKYFATCNKMLIPPLIEINVNTIYKFWGVQIRQHLKNYLTHELIHCLQYIIDENEAYKKTDIDKINLFDI